MWVFQKVIPPKGKKTPEELEVRFYRLNTGRATQFEIIKPYNPTTVDWCKPEDMKEGDYLMMDPAFEVNEKGTRENNDGDEALEKNKSAAGPGF